MANKDLELIDEDFNIPQPQKKKLKEWDLDNIKVMVESLNHFLMKEPFDQKAVDVQLKALKELLNEYQ